MRKNIYVMFVSCVVLNICASDNNIIVNMNKQTADPYSLQDNIPLPLNLLMNDEDYDGDSDAKDVADTVRKQVSRIYKTNLKSARNKEALHKLASSMKQLSSSSSSSSGGSNIEQQNNDDISSELVAYSHVVYSLLVKKEMESRDDKRRSEEELERQRYHTKWGYAFGVLGFCGLTLTFVDFLFGRLT